MPVQNALPGTVLGVEDHDLFPYSEFRKGRLSGIFATILEHISSDKNIGFDLQAHEPWRLNDLFETGDIALRFPDNPAWNTSHTAKKMFSDPVLRFVDQYYALTNKEPDLSAAVVVGSIHGYTLPVSDQSQYVDRCEWFRMNDQLVDALASEKVSIIYGNAYALEHTASKKGLKISRFPYFPPREGYYHFSCRMEHSGSLMEINDWIKANRDILDTWSGETHIPL